MINAKELNLLNNSDELLQIETPAAMMLKSFDNSVIAELCSRYYELKSKVHLSGLTFNERVELADELITGLKRNEIYHYRRDPSLMSNRVNINLGSNDYLNFTRNKQVIEAGQKQIEISGAGSGSVPMLAGTHQVHLQLEERIASFTGFEKAILFNSGFAANVGVLSALLASSDIAILDTHVHASIIDGCQTTNKIYFKHNDPASLAMQLQKCASYRNKLVVIEGIYSMDGDIALIDDLIKVAREFQAWILVDESHSIGVYGEQGRGLSYRSTRPDIITASMGKAMGGIGGFAAGSSALISLLELTSRAFIFSTSIPPASAAALVKAIDILESDPTHLRNLWDNINYFKTHIPIRWLQTQQTQSAIFPLIINNEEKLLELCRQLYRDGIFVNPVFYPVVPKKKSRIRISLTAGHDRQQLDGALEKIAYYSAKLNI